MRRADGMILVQGGSEARHSNELLHHIISNAIDTVAPEVGSGLIALVNSRDEIRDLLKLDDVIDLVRAPSYFLPFPPSRTLVMGCANARCHCWERMGDIPLLYKEQVILSARQ